MKQKLFTAIGMLILISISCVLAYYYTRHFDLIPKFVLHLPEVYVSTSDLLTVIQIFVTVFLLQIIATACFYKTSAFSGMHRFAQEYLFYLFAYTTASLYLFLATTINYDPQLIAGIGLISSLMYWLTMVVVQCKRESQSFVQSTGNLLAALFKRIFSVWGVIVLVYFLVPLAMGKAFTADRDIANKITSIRIWFNPVGDSEWGLKNLYPEINFAQPVLVTQTQSQPEKLYVLERNGKIVSVSFPAATDSKVELDISDQMGEVEMENGAVGLAFHPNFGRDNHYIYVYYTDTRPEGKMQFNRISRFDLTSDSLEERKASEFELMKLSRGNDGFHNGGSLEFGPDGFLYIGFGEGVHDRKSKTSENSLRGGVLRIDVDMNEDKSQLPSGEFTAGELQGYLVPKDNPFIGNDAVRDEFWALGLRNPFRFTFDPDTGDLWLGDVGSTIWEEINLIKKGYNYQFPHKEGFLPSGKKGWEQLDIPEQVPVYAYEHNAYDRAVIGGMVYRGDLYPSLKDKYVFADNYSAKVFVMPADLPKVEEVELIARGTQFAQRGVSSVVQLPTGEILITTLGAASEPSGEILMLVRAEEADVEVEQAAENSKPVDYNEEVTASMFAINCARCHGVKGDGKGPDSELLGVEIADFTSPLYQSKRSDDEIRAVIERGGAATGYSPLMPPWGEFLKPEEVDHLVMYIRSLPEKHHQH